MTSARSPEHFVTFFDGIFLPMGMCLHASLMRSGQPFRLWIVCMDDNAERYLRELGLPQVTLIPYREIENDALRDVKKNRTRREYFWTITPFTPELVLKRDKNVDRVTYVDADIFFLDSPQILLEEFRRSGKDVLITEHAYAPEYDRTSTSGKYCVQFMSFRRSEGALNVMHWWQERCLEWCFEKCEGGRFGDQKYLDDWAERFANEVHVLKQVEKTLAPWNVRHLVDLHPDGRPVFYHFHGLQILTSRKVRLYAGYEIGGGRWIYDLYLKTLKSVFCVLQEKGIPIPVSDRNRERFHAVRVIRRVLLGLEKYASI